MAIPKAIREATIGASDSYVQALPDEHIDIREHGAKVDGSHDDRDAVQSAIDAAAQSSNPDVVYLPAGTTFISDTIFIRGKHSGITICGDGSDSHIQLAGGHSQNASIFKINPDQNPLTGFTLRDLRLDGQGDKQGDANIRGITAIESGTGDDNNLVENIWFQESYAVNCLWGIPGTTLRYISTWGAKKWHGLGLGCEVSHVDRPIVVEYCHSYNNAMHGIDASDGHTVIRHVLSEENGWGGKNTLKTLSSTWEHVVFRNNDNLGWMVPSGDCGDVTMNNVMAMGNDNSGFYFGGTGSISGSNIVALENSADKKAGNIWFPGDWQIDVDTVATGSSVNGYGLHIDAGSSGRIGSVTHDGANASGPVSNSSSTTIGTVSNGLINSVSVPTNPDSTSSGGTDASYERNLEIDGANVSELSEYSITVSDRINHTTDAGTLNDSDTIEGTTASGVVLGGLDAYDFAGEITDALFTGDVDNLTVRVDGSEIDLDEFTTPQHTLEIDGSNVSEYTEYSITVNDAIEHDSATKNDGDTISGMTATGAVFGGLDAYYFDGEITDVTITGDAQNFVVRVDGSAVDLSQYVQPANILEIAPSDTTEDQQDPIEFVVKTSGPIASETVESLTFYENDTVAVGFSYWWPTRLEFDGDLVEAHIPAGASVVLNGKQMAASEL